MYHHGDLIDAFTLFRTMLSSLPSCRTPTVLSVIGDGRLYRIDVAMQYAEPKGVIGKLVRLLWAIREAGI